MDWKVIAFSIPWILPVLTSLQWDTGSNRHYLEEASGPTAQILEATYNMECSTIYVVDSKMSSYANRFIKEVDRKARAPCGFTVIELEVDAKKPNISMTDITPLLQETSWLRRRSRCVIVIMVTKDPDFLEIVGQVGKMERLVGWSAKLLVVTEISFYDLSRIISYHWTYSMMSTMFLNAQIEDGLFLWTVYSFFPYSPGGPQVIKVATYVESLYVYQKQELFADKYLNFHGGVVNVTSLEHTPHFMSRVEVQEDGTEKTIIYGSDGMLLHAMEDKLNFTSYLMPVESWEEVLQLVVDRLAYMSPVYWELVPDHLVTHDMSVVYEHAYFAFSMLSIPPKPHWSGLFLPLTIDVWLGILISCVFAALTLALILTHTDTDRASSAFYAVAEATYDIMATLLDQNFNYLLPTSATGRILILAWLIFTFIISSAYKANLKAFLMKPAEAVRAETVEELVEAVDTVTSESYAHSVKIFFMDSDYPPYKKLGNILDVGHETSAGMQKAVEDKRAAHVDFRKHMHHVLVDKFTNPDGSTALYIGKTKIVHFLASWPVPFDLPFLPHLDDIIVHMVESGLMEKWYRDEIEVARRKSMKRQREYKEKLQGSNEAAEGDSGEGDGDGAANLTMGHLQGPFMIYAAGTVVSIIVFLVEIRDKIRCCC